MAIRKHIEATAQLRFPDLLALLKERAARINELEQLEKPSLTLNTAGLANEVKALLPVSQQPGNN